MPSLESPKFHTKETLDKADHRCQLQDRKVDDEILWYPFGVQFVNREVGILLIYLYALLID